MTIEQLMKAIERRGYTVATVPPDEQSPRQYEILLISRRTNDEIASTDWTLSHIELEQADVSLWFHALNERLMHLSDMQHHVRCLRCNYPLLRDHNIELAVKIHQHTANPMYTYQNGRIEPVLNPAVEAALRPVYRAAPDGPKSVPLLFCPRCHTELNETTVGEFDDFTDAIHREALRRGTFTLNEMWMLKEEAACKQAIEVIRTNLVLDTP